MAITVIVTIEHAPGGTTSDAEERELRHVESEAETYEAALSEAMELIPPEWRAIAVRANR